MQDTKSLLQSKTIWGSIITMASVGAQLAGIDIGDTGGWVNSITALIGAALSFYGRIKAVKRIRV